MQDQVSRTDRHQAIVQRCVRCGSSFERRRVYQRHCFGCWDEQQQLVADRPPRRPVYADGQRFAIEVPADETDVLGHHRPACNCPTVEGDERCERCYGWSPDWATFFATIASRRSAR
jgi:hypothetical protein